MTVEESLTQYEPHLPTDAPSMCSWQVVVLTPDGTEYAVTHWLTINCTETFDGVTVEMTLPAREPTLRYLVGLKTDFLLIRNHMLVYRVRVIDINDTFTADAHTVTLSCVDYGQLLKRRILFHDDEPGASYITARTPAGGSVTTRGWDGEPSSPVDFAIRSDVVITFRIRLAAANIGYIAAHDGGANQHGWYVAVDDRNTATGGIARWLTFGWSTDGDTWNKVDIADLAPLGTTGDQWLGLTIRRNVPDTDAEGSPRHGRVRAIRSLDEGENWRNYGAERMTKVIHNTFNILDRPFRVGNLTAGGDTTALAGRLYWAQLRTGIDPDDVPANEGSVKWRCDISEKKTTSASWVDPRHRAWTGDTNAMFHLADLDQFHRAWKLVAYTQAFESFGITRGTTGESGVDRTGVLQRGLSIFDAINEMAHLDQGFDWWVDNDLVFWMQSPRKVRNLDCEWKWGVEIRDLTRTGAAGEYASVVLLIGATTETDITDAAGRVIRHFEIPKPVIQEAKTMPVGRWERMFTYNDIVTRNGLVRKAKFHLKDLTAMRATFSLTLEQEVWNQDIGIGDLFWLRIESPPRINIRTQVRIEEIRVSLTPESEGVALAVRSEHAEEKIPTNAPMVTTLALASMSTSPEGTEIVDLTDVEPGGTTAGPSIGGLEQFASLLNSLNTRLERRERALGGAGGVSISEGGDGEGADEVWIGPDEPPSEEAELWVDTDEASPGTDLVSTDPNNAAREGSDGLVYTRELVTKSTAPTPADFGRTVLQIGDVWVVMPP